jgi:hypothetical protein
MNLDTIPTGGVARMLLAVLVFASIALLCCVLAGYVDAWRDHDDDTAGRDRPFDSEPLFTSSWFFYLNVFLCFVSMLGLILLL